jgi:hypothetical protein
MQLLSVSYEMRRQWLQEAHYYTNKYCIQKDIRFSLENSSWTENTKYTVAALLPGYENKDILYLLHKLTLEMPN